MKFNSTKKIIIFFAIVIVVLLGLNFAAFHFIQNAGTEVSTLERDVAVLRAQVVEFSKYTPEDMRNLARSVTDRFISRTNIVNFIENLEREARTQGVSVTIRSVGVEPLSVETTGDKEIIRLQFETRGSWGSTMNFLTYVEHLPYKIALQGLDLATIAKEAPVDSAEGGASSSTLWQGQFEITTLKFK